LRQEDQQPPQTIRGWRFSLAAWWWITCTRSWASQACEVKTNLQQEQDEPSHHLQTCTNQLPPAMKKSLNP